MSGENLRQRRRDALSPEGVHNQFPDYARDCGFVFCINKPWSGIPSFPGFVASLAQDNEIRDVMSIDNVIERLGRLDMVGVEAVSPAASLTSVVITRQSGATCPLPPFP